MQNNLHTELPPRQRCVRVTDYEDIVSRGRLNFPL